MNLRFIEIIMIFLALFLFGCQDDSDPEESGKIEIHYLGHASFALNFDNDIGVLMDYGLSNAYGLGNEIFDIGSFEPHIATYSHSHFDHYGGAIKNTPEHILTGDDPLEFQDIIFTPVPTSEASIEVKDNTSYVLKYKQFTVVHIGDLQSNISEVDSLENREYLTEHFPESTDLLLMTIGKSGLRDVTTENVVKIVELLKPRLVIPMHYWTLEEKEDFIALLEQRSGSENIKYEIIRTNDAKYVLTPDSFADDGIIRVIDLIPEDYK